MNLKKQKLISRIICSTVLTFLLVLNTGVAQVAYAAPADAKKAAAAAPTTPTPGVKCTGEGWTPTPDNANCQHAVKNTDGTDAVCQAGSHKSNVNSTDTNLVCTPNATSTSSAEDTKALLSNVKFLVGIQSGLNRLIWPVLVLIGGLMENDLLFGNGMEDKLQSIWIPIRNLVNILFVIVLVGLALYNVLGLAEDNSSIKSMLPKIVIGIIAVNFSFTAIKVVLDGINQLTTAVFTLPGQISEGLDSITKDPAAIKRFCVSTDGLDLSKIDNTSEESINQAQEFAAYHTVVEMPAFKTKLPSIKTTDSIDQINTTVKTLPKNEQDAFNKAVVAQQNSAFCNGTTLSPAGEIFLGHYNSRNAAFALALNMGKIVFYSDVDTKIFTTSGDHIEKLFTNTLFSMVLYIVYCASFVALLAVLLGRLVVMWLSIAVSPILLLMIASPTVKEKMGGLSKLSEGFTKNAIAPLIIALSMTVGWIMLKAVQSLDPAGSALDSSVLQFNASGIPVAGLNTLQDFIVAIGVIAVVWLGVFAAAEGTAAQFATDKIKDSVQGAGKWLGSLPFKHLPLIPINLPDHPHAHYSLSSIKHFADRMLDTSKSDNKLYEDLTGKKAANPEDLHNAKNKEDLHRVLRDASEQNVLDNPKWIEEMKTWKRGNATLYADMLGGKHGVENKNLANSIKKMTESQKPEEVSKAIDEIKKNPIVRDAKALDKPATAADGKPVKPAAPVPLTKDTAVGDKGKLGEILKGSDGKGAVRLSTVISQKTALATAIKNKNPEATRTAFKAIAKALHEGKPDLQLGDDELKAVLGDQFDEAKTAFTDEIKDGKVTKFAANVYKDAFGNPATPPPPPPPPPTPPAKTP